MIKRNKKAQFYLLTAIILIVVLFGIANTNTQVMNSPQKIKTNIHQLYELEAKNIINNAVYEGKNETQELKIFTQKFISNYDLNNKKLLIVYVYKNYEKTTIMNFMEQNVTIEPISLILEKSESIVITTQDITIELENGKIYDLIFDDTPKEFQSIIYHG